MTSPARIPLIQAILRQRAIAALLALQVALAVAASANALAMLVGDMQAIGLPSGMEEAGMVVVPMPTDGRTKPEEDLSRLRSLPGALGAVAMGGVPFGIDISIHASRDAAGFDAVAASEYEATAGAVDALGLELIAGREFSDDESRPGEGGAARVALITRALARRLYHHVRGAPGALLYTDEGPLRVVGVVAHLVRGQPSPQAGPGENDYSLLRPGQPEPHLGAFMIRTRAADARAVAIAAAESLSAAHPPAVAIPATLADARRDHFARAQADVALLAASTLAFLAVTAMGVIGLSFFQVRKRTAEIGIRRALGACRRSVTRGLLLENATVVAAGNVAGLSLAIAANRWLVAHSGMSPLPGRSMAAAMAATWIVAAAAASIPALWAASIAPASALRVP
jgi:putative ABC transport system permease protein